MNQYELFNNCKARIHNQLRIHWIWLRKEEDYKEVFKFIECCMNQAVNRTKENEKLNPEFMKNPKNILKEKPKSPFESDDERDEEDDELDRMWEEA